jgi:ribonuclease HI
MSTIDQMSFDGSCDPNPGGRMGWSYIITFVDGRSLRGHDQAQANPANTVNVGEYRGLRAGLQAYLAAGRTGPLRITGDSQLIINQVNGIYKVRNDALRSYHAEVSELTRKIRDLAIVWNAREHNTAADMLARGESPPDQGSDVSADDRYLHDDLQAGLSAAVVGAIERINQHPAPGFKDLAGLRTGGIDPYSKLALDALQVRAGAEAAELIRQAFHDPKVQATALRWALRGLGVRRAIRKVQVDAEISTRSQRQTTPSGKRRS